MEPAQTRLGWRRPVVVDVVVVVVMAIVLVILVTVASEPGSRAVNSLAYFIVLTLAAIQLFRRRRPALILILSLLLTFVYHALNYPAIGNFPLAVPLFTAALMGHGIAITVAVFATLATLAWMLLGEAQPFLITFGVVVREAAIMFAMITAGFALRSRRLLTVETRERLRLAQVEQEARTASERMRIARELHDVVAHTVAVIGIQARVAADSADDDPDQTKRALAIISSSTREATDELRATIEVLREGDLAPLAPVPGLDQVRGLIEAVESGGLPVELEVAGERRRLPGSVELTAYRVVQESLTNVVRHSRASKAAVRIDFHPHVLAITVADNGTGGSVDGGLGILGMRERVTAAGGTLEVGPGPDGGFRVRAEIPLNGTR